MLPLLAESLNAVSTDSSIVLVALPGEKYRHPGSSWYVKQLSEAQRKKIKAEVEISEVGRGVPTFDTNRRDRYLAEWLATAALALGLQVPMQAAEIDAQDFPDAKQFRSASIPAITVSSQPIRKHIHSAAAICRSTNSIQMRTTAPTNCCACFCLILTG